MEESQRILKLAVSIGEDLLRCGGEIYRVQETVERVLRAYDIEDYHIFVVSNGIFVTVHEEREDRGSVVRNVPLGSVNLGRIQQLNQLSREICSHQYTVEEASQKLHQYQQIPGISRRTRLLASGLACASFCWIYGGRPRECLVAFFLGILLQIFILASSKRKMSKFVTNILGSGLVTASSQALAAVGLPILPDEVVIGSIIILVPGMVLTNGIRELFDGDYLSGSIHLIDALLTAVCIAVGVGGAIKLIQLLGGISL